MAYLSRFSLEGKVALITGASRGIGRSTALAFAEAGADVALASRKQEDLDKVEEEIKAWGRKALPIAAHTGKLDEIHRLVEQVASQYGRPPLAVSHGGGIFTTKLLDRGSEVARALLAENERVRAAMGLLRGVSHTEFIRGADGHLYFLETAARVGGAHIAELVEAATGVNLWAEWANLEIAGGKVTNRTSGRSYAIEPLPKARQAIVDAGGLIPYARRRMLETPAKR